MSTRKDRDRFHPRGERGPIKPFDFDESRYVFISYPRTTDPDLLRAIVRSLLRRGIGVWMYDPAACQLTAEEERGVKRQVSDKDWQAEALSALEAAPRALLLVGTRTLVSDYQLAEVTRSGELGNYTSARVDDTPFEKMPAAIQERKVHNLDVTKEDPATIAKRIEILADDLAKGILGARFVPVRKTLLGDGLGSPVLQIGLVVALAFVVGGGAAITGWLVDDDRNKGSLVIDAPDAPSTPVTDSQIHTGPRFALVISQTKYDGSRLSRIESAEAEGDVIAGALKQLNFDVDREHDLKTGGLRNSLDAFRRRLASAGSDAVGFIYYTGHGVQHPNFDTNYLLGVDAELKDITDLGAYGVNLTEQRDAFRMLKTAGVFLVFDACRNVPALVKSAGSSTKGLRRLDPLEGMLVAYSTSAGEVAVEGRYAPILAKELVKPNRKIETAFTEAKDKVAQATGGGQRPYNESRIYGLCLTCTSSEPAQTKSP